MQKEEGTAVLTSAANSETYGIHADALPEYGQGKTVGGRRSLGRLVGSRTASSRVVQAMCDIKHDHLTAAAAEGGN